MAGARAKAEADSNASVAQGWLIASLSRAKKIPKLESLLARRIKPQQRQSRDVMQAMCDALAAAWGARKG